MIVAAGVQLREARESIGLAVEDVAARLKVPVRYVHALEQGDMSGLPEPTFVRGYVKAYARIVGLEAEPLVAQLAPVEVKAPRQLVNVDSGGSGGAARRHAAARMPNFRGGSRRRYGPFLAVVGVVVIVAVVAAAMFAALSGTDAPAPVVTTAPVAVAPTAAVTVAPKEGTSLTVEVALPGVPAALPESAPAAALPAAGPAPAAAAAVPAEQNIPRRGLHIRFRGPSWVEVRDADNLVLHTSNQVAGGELTLDGKPPFSVTFNDASVADVWYNGAPQIDRSGRGRVNRMIVGQSAR